MILNPSQAKAVYEAMRALNNVSATLKAQFGDLPGDAINVFELTDGIHVVSIHNYNLQKEEEYDSQTDFAEAYGVL